MGRPGVVAITAAVLSTVSIGVAGCGSGSGPSESVITSTTQIVGAGVLGNARRPDASCAAEPAELDPGPPTREAHNAAGVNPEVTEVPADPQRIVVLAGDALDALCALGLQSRIVAAALPDGSDAQPSYLGTAVHDLAAAGDRGAPDLAAIDAAHPDLILGSQALTPQLYGELAKIAPTVFTAAPGVSWEDNLRAVAAATGRAKAADTLIDGFAGWAEKTGFAHDATHYQVSVVQLTDDSLRIYGAANFPATVIRAFGAGRPGAQRFTDQPFVEVAIGDKADYSAADGDIVFVSFAGPAAKDRAETVLDSDPWRALSATHDNRVFVVNNEVWQTGQGIVAARGIVDDLTWVNAPVN